MSIAPSLGRTSSKRWPPLLGYRFCQPLARSVDICWLVFSWAGGSKRFSHSRRLRFCYLATEELLVEAHEVPETPLATATFFAGFLLLMMVEMLTQV